MSVRVSWQDLYAIEQSNTSTNYPTFSDTHRIGVEGTAAAVDTTGKFLLPVTEHAHLNPGTATVEHELATGASDRITQEYNTVVAEPPTTTLTMPLTTYNLSLFLGLLFQNGTSEDTNVSATRSLMTCVPYTSAITQNYAHVARVLGTVTSAMSADTETHILSGAICNSLTITGEEGDILFLTAELMGTEWSTATDNAISNSDSWTQLTQSTVTPLKWQDFTTELDGSTVDLPGFSITITNSASAVFYSNATIKRFALGRLNVEGNIFIPWSDTGKGGNTIISDFTSGTDYTLEIFNTDGASGDNKLDIALNIRPTEVNFEGDVEIGNAITFQAVDDASNASINIKAGYLVANLKRIKAGATAFDSGNA